MARVFVHFADCVTVRVPLDDSSRISDLAAAFLGAYSSSDAARSTGGPPPAAVELRTGDNQTLDLAALTTGCLRDGDDVTAVAAVARAPASQATPDQKQPRPQQPRRQAAAEGSAPGLPELADDAPSDPPAGGLSGLTLSDADVKQLLATAKQLDDAKRLAAANTVYEKVLANIGMSSSHAPACVLALARNALAIEQPEKALSLLRRGVDAHPRDVALLTSLGDALLRTERASDAVQCLNTALRVRQDARRREGPSVHDIQALCARALYAAGARQQAASLVMQVLHDTQEGHIGALVEYASISADQGNHGDVVSSLLRVLSASAGHRTDARVQAMLAASASTDEGLATLFDRVCGASSATPNTNAATAGPDVSASALAFVATALKDAGAVSAAAKVLQRACGANKASPGLALAHGHAWEACYDTSAALDALRAWFQLKATALAGSACTPADARIKPYVLACASILQAPPLLPALPTSPGNARFEWLFTDRAFSMPADAVIEAAAGAPEAAVPPSAEALEALACAITAVKLLFCGGALARATALANIAHAWVTATSGALHETAIRNEAAYGSCIHLLLTRHPPAVPPAVPEEQPMYVLGDSHVLPCAWRTVMWQSSPRVLVPCVVTGVKAYHLRPRSTFYPKRQWERACARLPPGAAVMVMVGEIDCREGMLRAIEKGCAPDLAAAARDVVRILMDALVKSLLTGRSRASAVLVHPVPPVLDVTRHHVLTFNAALGDAVARARATHPALRWLGGDDAGASFMGRLLTPDGSAMRPEYVLDGTHLSPAYISDVLQDALNSA